jgi:lipopolysaccharide biosynthesis regulator YciM
LFTLGGNQASLGYKDKQQWQKAIKFKHKLLKLAQQMMQHTIL